MALLDERRHRRRHGVRRRRADAAGVRGRASGPRARREGRGLRRGGPPVVDEVGELVLTEPLPSMPLYFWGDDDGSRYRESYFSLYPGIWRHGDWIEITSRGTAIIYGRSDSTINRGGIRIGTSEIYRAVLAVDEVLDALVLDLPRTGTTAGSRSSSCCARAQCSTTSSRRDQAPAPRGLLAAPRARRDPPARRGAADALGQAARGAGQADPDGRRPSRRRAASRSRTRRRSTTSSSSPPAGGAKGPLRARSRTTRWLPPSSARDSRGPGRGNSEVISERTRQDC